MKLKNSAKKRTFFTQTCKVFLIMPFFIIKCTHIFMTENKPDIVSSTLKCNQRSKRLKKEKRDAKMVFSNDKKYGNDIQSHLRKKIVEE